MRSFTYRDGSLSLTTCIPTALRQERNIGNFSCWKDHDAYQKAFDRLLRDLKAESAEASL